MRPLPTSNAPETGLAIKPASTATPVAQTLELGPLAHASPPGGNRRAACPMQRAYPWLLVASTGMAAIFCGLYLNKPVIIASESTARGPVSSSLAHYPALAASAQKAQPDLAKSSGIAPQEEASKPFRADPRQLTSQGAAGADTTYEETNLRIQHVLKAQGPQGEDLGKIMLEVPVLYRSRALRWTPEEIEKARTLMKRIADYQDASQYLRKQGQLLLGEWNTLIGESIPAGVLRADSPTLSTPESAGAGAGLDSTEAIEIQNR